MKCDLGTLRKIKKHVVKEKMTNSENDSPRPFLWVKRPKVGGRTKIKFASHFSLELSLAAHQTTTIHCMPAVCQVAYQVLWENFVESTLFVLNEMAHGDVRN